MRLIVLIAAAVATLLMGVLGLQARSNTCQAKPGEWFAPASGALLSPSVLFERMAGKRVVLLGERHDSAEDHRWQLYTLIQLHARRPTMALALEMFPRRLQPVLDRWVAGELSEEEFLRQSEWKKVWGYDARDYLPLFHFARMQRLPMLAVNVDRSLIEAIGQKGWEGVPTSQKEGLTRPAPPSESYRKALRQVFDHHPAKARGEEAFPFFVEAQTAWDRAMAEGIADFLRKTPNALVVGIVGAGHVRHGHGIAHQLKDLGIVDVGALLPWERGQDCQELEPTLADALFMIAPTKSDAPRLGVTLEADKDEGLRIREVSEGSIAQAAGLTKNDVITRVAGQPAKSIETLRQMVRAMPAGAWLPLTVKRGGVTLELVAKFPAEP
ncbi:MAG: ChaN family lipoprotein [Rhodocyclaceae bacterium]|nr:ChaN family lipoprotein [Rhodocyclaceae bacterium]